MKQIVLSAPPVLRVLISAHQSLHQRTMCAENNRMLVSAHRLCLRATSGAGKNYLTDVSYVISVMLAIVI